MSTAILICVPTPLKKNRAPDLSFVLKTGEASRRICNADMLVVLESTTYPGTTENELREVLERGSGLKAGKDFHLAFSPEREDPGNPDSNVAEIPKVIGGLHARLSRKRRRKFIRAPSAPWFPSRTAAPPRRRSCSKIFSAASTSRSSTNSSRFMARWTLTSGKSSPPRRRSRSASCRFIRGRDSADIASRLIRFISRGRRSSSGRKRASSNSRAKSTPPCREYVVAQLNKALASRKKTLRGADSGARPRLQGERGRRPRIAELRADGFAESREGAGVAYHDPHIPVIRQTREHPHWAGTKSVKWDRKNHFRLRRGADFDGARKR